MMFNLDYTNVNTITLSDPCFLQGMAELVLRDIFEHYQESLQSFLLNTSRVFFQETLKILQHYR